jgi:hypothetical protein
MLVRTARRVWFTAAAAALLLGGLPAAASATHPTPKTEVIARGLDNPRGITITDKGKILVAEAGRGGNGPCIPGPEGGDFCFGLSGAVTAIADGHSKRIATRLPSLAARDGSSAHGPHDLAVAGDTIKLVIGLDGAGNRPRFGPEGQNLGRLVAVDRSGAVRSVADLAAFELANNTDGATDQQGRPEVNSNPYSLLQVGKRWLVADAGANAVLKTGHDGRITPRAVFPPRPVPAPPDLGLPPGATIPMQSVPNSLAKGPDGAVYVGELTGFPFPKGAARVYRLEHGKDPEVVATGFTNIIDIAFDHEGRLLVLQISSQGLATGNLAGALIRVEHDGSRTTLAEQGLLAPAGVAVADDGTLYVTNKGVMAGQGEVLRIST